jgi:hypothetical protein
MLVLRLFLTRVVSGVALHATVTVIAGVAASAGRVAMPPFEAGPTIVSANASKQANSRPTAIVDIEVAVVRLIIGMAPFPS